MARKVYLRLANAIAGRLSNCFVLLIIAEGVGEVLAGKVKGATPAWCKRTVLNQTDKSGVRKSGGPNSIHLSVLQRFTLKLHYCWPRCATS